MCGWAITIHWFLGNKRLGIQPTRSSELVHPNLKILFIRLTQDLHAYELRKVWGKCGSRAGFWFGNRRALVACFKDEVGEVLKDEVAARWLPCRGKWSCRCRPWWPACRWARRRRSPPPAAAPRARRRRAATRWRRGWWPSSPTPPAGAQTSPRSRSWAATARAMPRSCPWHSAGATAHPPAAPALSPPAAAPRCRPTAAPASRCSSPAPSRRCPGSWWASSGVGAAGSGRALPRGCSQGRSRPSGVRPATSRRGPRALGRGWTSAPVEQVLWNSSKVSCGCYSGCFP